MIKQQVYILNSFLMLTDAIAIVCAGYGAYYFKYFFNPNGLMIDDVVFMGSIVLVMFVNNYTIAHVGLYSETRNDSFVNLIVLLIKAIVPSFVVLVTAVYLYKEHAISRDFIVYFSLLSVLFLLVERLIIGSYIRFWAPKNFNSRKFLIVGDAKRGQLVSELLRQQLSWGHEVIGILSDEEEVPEVLPQRLGNLSDLCKVLESNPVDEVVFVVEGDRSLNLRQYSEICKTMGIPARILPALWQPGDISISAEGYQGVPFLVVGADHFNASGLLYKRILDFVGGLVGTLILIVLYPIIGLLIKLDSPGPVLFKQERVGYHGRVFYIFKFRTMLVNAEARKKELLEQNEMQGAMFKMKDDPRITKIGKFLRRTSIDEIPQFLNVLKGEMSLVGTRPPTVAEVEQYDLWHRQRISAKPGMTGLWQISGRNKITDFDQIVALDCQYLDKWRFVDDIKIIFKTILIVLLRKGAV